MHVIMTCTLWNLITMQSEFSTSIGIGVNSEIVTGSVVTIQMSLLSCNK